MSNLDECNAVKDDCSYALRSATDSNPLLEQFLDEWKEELYRKSTILRLNDDCFLHLFKFMPSMDLCALRHTCSRFRPIADYWFEKRSKSFRLERSYVYGSFGSPNKEKWLNDAKRLIQNYGQFITKLSIQKLNFHMSENPASLVRLVDRYCINLKDLALHDFDLEPATFSLYERLFLNLHRLVISGWKNEEAIECCLAHCGSLKELEFHDLEKIEGNFLAERFASLESLTMLNCRMVNSDKFTDFLGKNGQLKKMRLCGSHFNMSHIAEGNVITWPSSLESLCLISNDFIFTQQSVRHFPTTLKRLEVDPLSLPHINNNIEYLHVFCYVGTTDRLESRLCEMKTLKILKLTDAQLDAKSYQNIACKLTALSELHFIDCSTNLIDIIEFVKYSANLKKIVFLPKNTKNGPQRSLTKTMLLSIVEARLQNKQHKETLLLFLKKMQLVDIHCEFEKNGDSNLFVDHTDVIKLLPWTTLE